MNQRKLRLDIAYDGTRYHGWQRQKNAVTIQETIEDAVAQITGEGVVVHGAGRTDAGVHALGQVAHVSTSTQLNTGTLHRALNAVLPSDIAILRICEASPSFHARFSAISKTYRYTIWNAPVRPVFQRAFVHHISKPLNVDVMRRAAQALLGEREFRAFATATPEDKNTVRNLFELRIEKAGPRIDIYASANGFLYNMVRAIVGTLVWIARGKMSVEEMLDALAAGDRGRMGDNAPPQGLCLMRVEYGDE